MAPETTQPNVSRFADLIRVASRAVPSKIALVSGEQTYTYSHLLKRAQRLASGLLQTGLKPGDSVGVLSANRPEYIEIYMALQFAGLVAVPVNFRLVTAEVHYILSNCQARGAIVEDQYCGLLNSLLDDLPSVLKDAVVVVGDHQTAHESYEGLISRSEGLVDCVPLSPFAPAAIFYTSGTTGFPKGAKMSHLNILTRMSSWGWEFGLNSEDVVLVPGPVFHNSFSAIALITLAVGGTVVLMREFDGGEAADLIDRYGVTWGFLVPKMIELLVGALRPDSGRTLRGILSSGSPLPQPLLDTVVTNFPRLRLADAYGWTESGWLTICRHDDLLRGKKSVGRAGFGCEVAVLGPGGQELAANEVGEIHAANPIRFLGYHNNPDATEGIRKGKWETGGDVGYLDEDGFLHLVDRKNDMIISGGENIYPAEIERVLFEHPKIMEAAVIGVADSKWGEAPCACVVLNSNEKACDQDILSYFEGKLARYKHPRSVVFLDALPRNAMGKVLRRELRDRYGKSSGSLPRNNQT